MTNPYRVIFFDLDHTLWDYDKNSNEALSDLYYKYKLDQVADLTLDLFFQTFIRVNDKLWKDYDKGHIDRNTIREKRFYRILKTFGVDDPVLSLILSDEYIDTCPQKTHLFPHTIPTLEYLTRKYRLFILTNGFDDVQETKLRRSQLAPFFNGMITSETTGHRKPSKEIFHYALEQAVATHHETLMIGDNLSTDISGAQNASIDTVFFNPHRKDHKAKTNYEIDCLSQLRDLL